MRMSGENGETLHLTQLERESAGGYACAATNDEGESRSSSITLKIQCKYLSREALLNLHTYGPDLSQYHTIGTT